MSEQPVAKVEATIELEFSDYLAVQLWSARQGLIRRSLSFIVIVLAIVVLGAITGTGSLTDLGVPSQRRFAFLVILAGYLLFLAGPFIGLGALRLQNKLPRQIRISMDFDGLTFSTNDHDVIARWASLLVFAEDRSAYLLRFKSHALRLPKRGFTSQQLSDFEKIIATNVPASAVRIVLQ